MALVAVPIYWYWPRGNTTGAGGGTSLRINANLGSRDSGVMLSGDF